jgi:hypothetical protein
MRKSLISAAAASVLFIVGIAPAAAWYEPGDSVDARQQRQYDRIAQGVRSGELTRHEARFLIHEQRAISRKEAAYRSDGVLTRAELRDLHDDLNRAREPIYNQRHDADFRPPLHHSRDDGSRDYR